MAGVLKTPAWPSGASVAVALTFDVDGEAPRLGSGKGAWSRMSTLSEGRYGIVRGLPRILDLLQVRGIKATFYVPGVTAEIHAGAVQEIVAAGHEIGHHGYLHLHSDGLTLDEQREEVVRGLDALENVLGVKPVGYRSPSWELTPATFALLVEHGFRYDSSCMGDDRPYVEEVGGAELVELPVHWSLDDWPYYCFGAHGHGNLTSPSTLSNCWVGEFDAAIAEKRMVTYTMHPEVIGRGYRFETLVRLIDHVEESGVGWFGQHREIAGLLGVE